MTDQDQDLPLQLSELPVVDLKKAREVGGVADNFLHDMFQGFRDHYKHSASSIRDLLDTGKHKEAQILAHSIVGISGSLGAARVSATATKLDRALTEELDQSVIDGAWVEFQTAIGELMTFIEDRYPTHPEV